MKFFADTGRVLKRELNRIVTYPIHITIMAILPVLAFSFFAIIFSKGVTENVPIAVLDNDKSNLSRQLISMIDATASCMVSYEISDFLEGEDMIKSNQIQAFVHIPYNFEKDVYDNVRTSVEGYISGLNITANGLISKDLLTVMTTFSSGIQLQVLMSGGLSEKQAMAQLLPVYFDQHILFNPYVNYGYYLLPSFLPLMLMVFTIMLTIFSIGTELKNGTAGAWMQTARGRVWPAVIGKLFPYTTAMFIMSLFMNTIMYKWVGVPMNGSLLLLILNNFLFILSYQSIGILIITVLSNLRQSLSIGGGYSVLAFTYSGLTFPRMAMDPALQVASYIFPFTLYTDVFIDQAMRGAPPVYSVHYLGFMCLFIVLPLFCLPRLKRISTDEKFWRRM